jgi:hypothetical protein
MVGRAVVLLIAWMTVAGAAGAQEMATTRVSDVDTLGLMPVVLLDAGAAAGLVMQAEVTLLRELEPIVHPLTNVVLGIPQEPVGIARIIELEDDWAAAQLVRVYSTPLTGDIVEFARQRLAAEGGAAAVDTGPQVDEVLDRMRDLEQHVAQTQHRQQQMANYPVFAREVWEELHSVRSYLVSMDERLLSLEMQQGQDRDLLDAVVSGEYESEEMRQFTVRYSPDTQVRLRVAGKTLVIDVERDSLHIEELVGEDELSDPLMDGMAVDGMAVDGEEESGGLDLSLLSSPFVQAASLGVIALLAGVLYVMMRRHQRGSMEDLEDFEAEYTEEEEEEF